MDTRITRLTRASAQSESRRQVTSPRHGERRLFLCAVGGLFGGMMLGSEAVLAPRIAHAHTTPFGKRTLFVLTRSTNDNTVYYDLRFRPDGALARKNPVDVYWRMFEDDGHREELTWLERNSAYGCTIARFREEGFQLRLAAFDQRAIHVTLGAKYGHRALVKIASNWVVLHRIHVEVESGVLGPDVQHVDLFGRSAESGEEIRERIRQ